MYVTFWNDPYLKFLNHTEILCEINLDELQTSKADQLFTGLETLNFYLSEFVQFFKDGVLPILELRTSKICQNGDNFLQFKIFPTLGC